MAKQSRSLAESKARCKVRLGRHLEKHLAAYAAAATGAVLLSAAPSADAEIVYTPSNTPFTHNHQNQGPVFTTLDLNNDGVADFTFAVSSTAHFSSIGYTTRFKLYMKVVPDQTGNEVVQGSLAPTASAVPAGVTIGPKEKFVSGGYMVHQVYSQQGHINQSSGSWQKVEFAYIGLKFLINGQVHYGWARVKFPYPYGYNYPSIYGYAYESSPNTPIVSGQTSGTAPTQANAEAIGSLGMLAAGASALNLSGGSNLK
ncbi:MAG: hypothetical protein WAM04_00340 [Candidatus Sulfotelmatobacter sp.]